MAQMDSAPGWAGAGEPRATGSTLSELATQLEDLLHTVWMAEKNWAFDDRLEMSLHQRLKRRRD